MEAVLEVKLPLVGDFAVEITEHCIVLRGQCPISMALAIANVTKDDYGYDQIDTCMPSVMDAIWVIGSDESLKRLRAEHDARIAHLPPLEKWCSGWDKGISSMTMLAAIVHPDTIIPNCCKSYVNAKQDVPHDADDFGRCVRLLEAMPEFRPQLHKVSDKHPEWGQIIANWDGLEFLYHAGQYNEVTRLLQEYTGKA